MEEVAVAQLGLADDVDVGQPRQQFAERRRQLTAGQLGAEAVVDAAAAATRLGNPRAANTVLLGTLSAVLDFPEDIWEKVIAKSVPEKTIDINLDAFRYGRQWIETVRENPDAALPASEVAPPPTPNSAPNTAPGAAPALDMGFELAITEAWCKGCDICVKMCPERCLSLNAENIAVLTDADACTGCRVCEWLCPDFAISVTKQTTPQTQAAE